MRNRILILIAVIHSSKSQLVDNSTGNLKLLLYRPGVTTNATTAGGFGDEHTVALDRDTLAVGSFYSQASCGGWSGSPCPSYAASGNCDGCILDTGMAATLVDWFGNYDWYLAYSGSKDGFSNSNFYSKLTSSTPSIVLVYSYHLSDGTVTGTNIFGGYTSKGWSSSSNLRCADSSITGGSGSTSSCHYWQTCLTNADCLSLNGTCTCSTVDCNCCQDNACISVCSHSSDGNAALFTLMSNSKQNFVKFPTAGVGREIFICPSDSTFGPTFGAQGSGATNNVPPYTDFALKLDLSAKTGSTANYGFTGLTSGWATGIQSGWRIDQIEIYSLVSGSSNPRRGIFQYAPRGAGASGDMSVHVWYRNLGGKDAWNYLKQVVLPSWADSWMYGFSVALDLNTLVVGRRGNRDIYVHERHRSDCTPTGSYYSKLCGDRGYYSADNWGLVQQISFPGNSLADVVSRNIYGGVWTPPSCCSPPPSPSIEVGEWGCSVAIRDEYLIVGAYTSSIPPGVATGAAFIYQRDYTGDFIFAAELAPLSNASYQHCGWDVAIDGDYAIVGCYGSPPTANTAGVSGSVLFFERNPPDGSSSSQWWTWGQPPASSPGYSVFPMASQWPLMAARNAATCNDPPACQSTTAQSSVGDYFGYSVDISGSTAIVGAFMQRGGSGDAYVFERNFDGRAVSGDTMWQVARRLVAPDDASGLYFGFSVALEGSFALVTALKENDGRGYLFGRNYGGLNNWGFIEKASQPTVGSSALQFPSNSGMRHVWNYWSDGGGNYGNGAQLLHTAPCYNSTPMLQPSASASPVFGASAQISGNTIAIGAPYADGRSSADVGAVSLLSLRPIHRMSHTEFDEATLTATQCTQGDGYGTAVHITADGRYAVIGAPKATVSASAEAGSAYILYKGSSGSWVQASPGLTSSDYADGDNFGMALNSVDIRDCDTDPGASAELLVGAPGKTNAVLNVDLSGTNRMFVYPPSPRQSVGRTMPRAGAVYVFAKSNSWVSTVVTQAVPVAAFQISVVSAVALMGSSPNGTVAIGRNDAVAVLSWNSTVLFVDNNTLPFPIPAGTQAFSGIRSTLSELGFQQVEKLTALSTSCGQGGPDFSAVWDSTRTATHVSDYSGDTSVVLQQPLSVGDHEICINNVATLLGADTPGDAAPFSQGDPNDVIAYVRIGSNPSVGILNGVRPLVASSCAPSASRNAWTGSLPLSVYFVLKIASYTVSVPAAVSTVVFKAPLYTVSPPYTACLDGEYITSGRVAGGRSELATSADGSGSSSTLNCATGTGLPSCLTASAGLQTAFDTGASTVTVQSAVQLFEAVSLGVVLASSSATTFQLPSKASAVAGYYVGFDICLDYDGNIGTTTDVCTTTVVAYQSTRVITVEAGCLQPTAGLSIYTISRWQSRKFISTGSNLLITVTGVNFFTNELQVSGVVWPGFPGEDVYQTVSAANEIQLDPTSPSIDSLYNLCMISIIQGKGAGQKNLITGYRGSTRVAVVQTAWAIPPDATSQYIITGKPLCVSNLQVTNDGPSACAGDGFGFSIAAGRQDKDRHIMAVGAPWANSHQHCSTYPIKTFSGCTSYRPPLYEGGRVYIFERHSGGASSRWRMSRILEAPASASAAPGSTGSGGAMASGDLADIPSHAAASYDRFGYSVAILNDQVFVGSPWSGIDDSGAVFVFERNYAVILRGTVSCASGCSTVSFDIGTVTRYNSELAEGSPPILEDSYVGCSVTVGNAPKQETRVISAYSVAGWQFGGAATITVSSPFSSLPDTMTQFKIHSGSLGTCGVLNKWGLKQTLVGSSRRRSDFFGWSLAVTSSILVVGSPGYDAPYSRGPARLQNKLTDSGAVFVFELLTAAALDGRDQPRWTETQRLTQTSNTSTDSNILSRLVSSLAINKDGDTIVAGAPLHDADAFQSKSSTQSQKTGWLGAAGAVVIFRKQASRSSSPVTADFAPTYRSETIQIKVADVGALLGDDPSGTVAIGENRAIEIVSVDRSSNTMRASAPTVAFASARIANGLSMAAAIRRDTWRKDETFTPSSAVAFGGFGHSVSMWDSGDCLVGAPNGESETACCGSMTNTGIRCGSGHSLVLSRPRPSLDYDGSAVESGLISNVADNLTMSLAATAPNYDGAYEGYSLRINAESRLIVEYDGPTRTAIVDSGFSTAPVASTAAYTVSSPAYSAASTINDKSSAGVSCLDLLQRGFAMSGNYWLDPSYSLGGCAGEATAFVGYCDQATDGGGWLMCYTEGSQVDLASEHGFRASSPYPTDGYRSDCRSVLFNQVLYVFHAEVPSFESADRVVFDAGGRRPILASHGGWKGTAAHDAYGNLTFSASSADSSPASTYRYQLAVCASGYGAGFFMSGLLPTPSCPDGWKACDDWCGDHASEYYRHAYSPKKNAMGGVPVNFTGVAFQENGHRPLGRRLMSVGIRNGAGVCASGWAGNGVQCTCPARHAMQNVVAYWRFEAGADTAPVRELIQDVARRTAGDYTADTRATTALGGGGVTTTATDNDLEYVDPFGPSFSAQAPQNDSFAVLCLANELSMEFSAAAQTFLQTAEYAAMNFRALSAFSWEFSVWFAGLAGQQTVLSWHNAAGTYAMSCYKLASHLLAFSVQTSSGTVTATGTRPLRAGEWNHLAVTYDGGAAGMIRLWHLDTGGAAVTGSDCVDRVCLTGLVRGRIGRRGGGLGGGLLLLGGATAGCGVGTTLSAAGGGVCADAMGLRGGPCAVDADCGGGRRCALGAGFSATVVAADASGAVADVRITNPGGGYLSAPSLVAGSAACTCNGLPGNVAGRMDACLRAVPGTADAVLKQPWVLEAEVAWPALAGWAASGDTAACGPAAAEPCPFTSTPTQAGWRWTVGAAAGGGGYLDGLLDEVRVSSVALDLASESLWRP